MRKDVITMVIPTYQRPELLQRTVLSVLNQTYPHLRVCVYDNDMQTGTKTEQIMCELKEQDSRVKYERNEENLHTYGNFNKGVNLVDTPYFSVMSDDDLLVPTFFEQAMEAFDTHPEAQVVAMDVLAVDHNFQLLAEPTLISEQKFYPAGEGLYGSVKGTIPGSSWSGMIFNSQIASEIGGPLTDAGPFADAGYLWHVVSRYSMVVTPGVAALYMVHPDNMATEVRMMPLEPHWPEWWDKMVKPVEHDDHVPAKIRKQIRQIVYPDFKQIARQQFAYFAAKKRPDLAKKSLDGLAACDGPSVTLSMLRTLLWVYSNVPFVKQLSRLVVNWQHRKTAQRRAQIHSKLKSHVAFVENLLNSSVR